MGSLRKVYPQNGKGGGKGLNSTRKGKKKNWTPTIRPVRVAREGRRKLLRKGLGGHAGWGKENFSFAGEKCVIRTYISLTIEMGTTSLGREKQEVFYAGEA